MALVYMAATPTTDTTSVGDRLLSENGSLGRELMPGQVLRLVPQGYHVVRAGQTFWSISRLYGTTVASLQAWNPGVTPTSMPVGTLLRVVKPL